MNVALNVPNTQLAGATQLGLLPTNAICGDGLIIIARGNLHSSIWGSATSYDGWTPF